MTEAWSEWRQFPDPRKLEALTAPIGPGCYELRHRGQKVLFGWGNRVAERMATLLRSPVGSGGGSSNEKRAYLSERLGCIEYRVIACGTPVAAKKLEEELKRNCEEYIFPS
jgi:hypothetical protein